MTAFGEAWKSWPLPEQGELVGLFAWHLGRCAWCGFSANLVRDHCHETGLVRGLLCRDCNQIEGWAEVDSPWKDWRSGDNPARALGHFEVYANHFGRTPLRLTSVLEYYTEHEREDWWAGVEATFPDEWPTAAPWTPTATARREADVETMRQAIESLHIATGGAA